jgi:hypothetical protein
MIRNNAVVDAMNKSRSRTGISRTKMECQTKERNLANAPHDRVAQQVIPQLVIAPAVHSKTEMEERSNGFEARTSSLSGSGISAMLEVIIATLSRARRCDRTWCRLEELESGISAEWDT